MSGVAAWAEINVVELRCYSMFSVFQGPSIKDTSGKLGKYSGEWLKEVKSFSVQKETA